jgi:ABC-type glutathione transport system ATPase component
MTKPPPIAFIDFCLRYGDRAILNGVTFHLEAGAIVALLGESGSGKTSLAQAVLGTLPAVAAVPGSVEYPDRAAISWIPQEPLTALHPLLRAREQVGEALRARGIHADPDEALRSAGLTDPRHWRAYPHQLSGGERQRVLIAQAIATRPTLLIADEPTASLDAPLQDEVLQLLANLRRERGMAILFITHNPLILRGFADRVLVLHGGKIVEEGSPDSILEHPVHPWTQSIAAALAHSCQ